MRRTAIACCGGATSSLTHLVSDILIARAYFSIPFALVRLVRRRPDVQFGGMFWLFALFIFACGMTHVMSAWNLWHGDYGHRRRDQG